MRRLGRRVLPYAGMVITAVLVGLPGLRAGTPHGDDLAFHVYRARGVVNALHDGQVVPQLDPWLVGGFGYAPNLFYGPLASWFVAALSMITPSWSAAVNLFLVVTFLVSGIGVFRFVREVLGGARLAPFVAAVLYQAAPYHLVDAWERQAHGETLAFVFAPLVLHGLWKIAHARPYGILVLSVGASGLVLAHSLSATMVAGLAAVLVLVDWRSYVGRRRLLSLFAAFVLTVAACAVFLLPFVAASRTMQYAAYDPGSAFVRRYIDTVGDHVLNPVELLVRSPGPDHSWQPSPTMGIGWPLVAVVVIAVVARRRIDPEHRRLVAQLVTVGVVAAISATSLVPWDRLPHAITYLAFPWRLLLITDLALAVAGGLVVHDVIVAPPGRRRRGGLRRGLATQAAVAGLTVVVAVGGNAALLAEVVTADTWNGVFDYRLQRSGVTAGMSVGEYLPAGLVSTAGRATPVAERGTAITVVSGRAEIEGAAADGTSHLQFGVRTAEGAVVGLPRIYYPGYEATIDDAAGVHPARVVPSPAGYVAVVVPAGTTGTVRLRFAATGPTVVGIALSTTAGVVMIVMVAGPRRGPGSPRRSVRGTTAAAGLRGVDDDDRAALHLRVLLDGPRP